MTKYTQKQLRAMVVDGIAVDISHGTNETRRANEESTLYNGFCKKCDSEGWHYCEKCGKPTKNSVYNNSIGGLVCKECSEILKQDKR